MEGKWQAVEAQRRVRKDGKPEVKAGGKWYLSEEVEWMADSEGNEFIKVRE